MKQIAIPTDIGSMPYLDTVSLTTKISDGSFIL